MLTGEGPSLIEYNARFGDPECQVLMMRLESDLLEILYATSKEKLGEVPPPAFSSDVALSVVMAARGYPGTPEKGGEIGGLDEASSQGAVVFHAGTAAAGGKIVADGGRVLAVTALGRSVGEARKKAYDAVDRIDFPSGFCRRDIGWREIGREG
jgi:phosphoribosylamine--glycine ligase